MNQKEKIKFRKIDIEHAVSKPTLKKAEKLFNDDCVLDVEYKRTEICASIMSTKEYTTCISYKDFFNSYCNCYAGQEDKMCKHVLALALYVLDDNELLDDEVQQAKSLEEAKVLVKKGVAKIRSYNGPSKTWFRYTHNLYVSAKIIEDAVVDLPAGKDEVKYLWKLVLRLSKKLATTGVDDSDGAVGGAIDTITYKIIEMAKEKEELIPLLEKFAKDDTGFGFEDYITNFLNTRI